MMVMRWAIFTVSAVLKVTLLILISSLFHSFGFTRGWGGLLRSKKQKRKEKKRKEEEASNMHFDVVTGELVVRADNELR